MGSSPISGRSLLASALACVFEPHIGKIGNLNPACFLCWPPFWQSKPHVGNLILHGPLYLSLAPPPPPRAPCIRNSSALLVHIHLHPHGPFRLLAPWCRPPRAPYEELHSATELTGERPRRFSLALPGEAHTHPRRGVSCPVISTSKVCQRPPYPRRGAPCPVTTPLPYVRVAQVAPAWPGMGMRGLDRTDDCACLLAGRLFVPLDPAPPSIASLSTHKRVNLSMQVFVSLSSLPPRSLGAPCTRNSSALWVAPPTLTRAAGQLGSVSAGSARRRFIVVSSLHVLFSVF